MKKKVLDYCLRYHCRVCFMERMYPGGSGINITVISKCLEIEGLRIKNGIIEKITFWGDSEESCFANAWEFIKRTKVEERADEKSI